MQSRCIYVDVQSVWFGGHPSIIADFPVCCLYGQKSGLEAALKHPLYAMQTYNQCCVHRGMRILAQKQKNHLCIPKY